MSVLRYVLKVSYWAEDKVYLIGFIDFPEAKTKSFSEDQLIINAKDCLEKAIFNRIKLGLSLPKLTTTTISEDELYIEIDLIQAMKLKSRKGKWWI